eukprot:3033759-Rhodomonas_salina.1
MVSAHVQGPAPSPPTLIRFPDSDDISDSTRANTMVTDQDHTDQCSGDLLSRMAAQNLCRVALI